MLYTLLGSGIVALGLGLLAQMYRARWLLAQSECRRAQEKWAVAEGELSKARAELADTSTRYEALLEQQRSDLERAHAQLQKYASSDPDIARDLLDGVLQSHRPKPTK